MNRFQFQCYTYTFVFLLFVQLVKTFPVRMSHSDYEFTSKRKSDHNALEMERLQDQNRGEYTWDIQSAVYGNYHPKLDIPTRNARQILVLSLLPLELEVRLERTAAFIVQILKKEPVFEKKEDIQVRELKLLSMGVVVQCQWAFKLPPPFNTKQCTVEELDSLIEKICVVIMFEPMCPLNSDHIPVLM